MRAAPQYGLATAIRWVNARSSELAGGRPSPFSRRHSGPIDSEALPLPTHDRVSLDQVQASSPRGPDSSKHHPELSIFPPQARNSHPPLKHSKLLANGSVNRG